jgi:integrase
MRTLGGPYIVKLKNPQKNYRFTISWRQAGKQHRRFFQSRAQAEVALRAMLLEREAHGNGVLELKASDREMLFEAKKLLAPYGSNLLDAVRYYVGVQDQIRGSRLVSELSAEFLLHKDQAGARHRYKTDLRRVMEHFCADFGSRLAAGIDSAEITRWLERRSTQWEKANYRRILSVFFAYAKAIGAAGSNPVGNVPKVRVPVARCEIFSVREVGKLLFGALSDYPLLVPYLAIGLFAGVRSAELARLDWSDITDTSIRIEPRTAKTASRRVIAMSENLLAWLLHYRKADGPIRPPACWRIRKKLCQKTEVKWKSNAMRHSFGSYHLAMHGNAARTALALGHSTPSLVFRHYRELVSQKQAQEYFGLVPPTRAGAEKLVAFG